MSQKLSDVREIRQKHLTQTAHLLVQALVSGQLVPKKQIPAQVKTISGPRAGAVDLYCGLAAEMVRKALTPAVTCQFITWSFPDSTTPMAYLPSGSRAVRVEAGWPDTLAEKKIHLRDIGTRPHSSRTFIVGKNEQGQTVTASLHDETPGFLIGGETGGGKSFAIRSWAAQLTGAAWGVPSGTRLVLLDGKYGGDLGPVANLPGVVGPLATDIASAQNALGWAYDQMVERCTTSFRDWSLEEQEKAGRIVVIIDEVQTFAQDKLCVELLRQLVQQGRVANVYTIGATQHPTVEVLNDSALKAGWVGRMGLRVTSTKASEVIFGGGYKQGKPRADILLGSGDCFMLTPRATQRAQVAFIPKEDLARMATPNREFEEWPERDVTQDPTRFSGAELGVALLHVQHGGGRDSLKDALRKVLGIKPPGSPRAGAMLTLAQKQLATINKLGFKICPR